MNSRMAYAVAADAVHKQCLVLDWRANECSTDGSLRLADVNVWLVRPVGGSAARSSSPTLRQMITLGRHSRQGETRSQRSLSARLRSTSSVYRTINKEPVYSSCYLHCSYFVPTFRPQTPNLDHSGSNFCELFHGVL